MSTGSRNASSSSQRGDRVAMLVATIGGIGLLPRAPGTFGSLAALPLAWVALHSGGPLLLILLALLLFLVGCWAAQIYSRSIGVNDPGSVVVDEVVGQWLTLLAVPMLGWREMALGFALFRLFDIWKPWPVSVADRRLRGGFGIMADDVLAAVYGGIVLALLAPFIARL